MKKTGVRRSCPHVTSNRPWGRGSCHYCRLDGKGTHALTSLSTTNNRQSGPTGWGGGATDSKTAIEPGERLGARGKRRDSKTKWKAETSARSPPQGNTRAERRKKKSCFYTSKLFTRKYLTHPEKQSELGNVCMMSQKRQRDAGL